MVPVRMKVEVREVQHGSPEYAEEIRLRNQILREPLGLKLREQDLAAETADIHLAAFANGRLVGCLILTPVDRETIKMRQVAVAEEAQGQGVGKQLVIAAEAKAHALGHSTIELNARENAVRFYLSLKYEIVGEPFVEVTLPHRKMRKHRI